MPFGAGAGRQALAGTGAESGVLDHKSSSASRIAVVPSARQ
jgi:hypothetical protein